MSNHIFELAINLSSIKVVVSTHLITFFLVSSPICLLLIRFIEVKVFLSCTCHFSIWSWIVQIQISAIFWLLIFLILFIFYLCIIGIVQYNYSLYIFRSPESLKWPIAILVYPLSFHCKVVNICSFFSEATSSI